MSYLTKSGSAYEIAPADVHTKLANYILADGYEYVLDIVKSNGISLYDERNDQRMLDFFSFYASSGLGMNHPKLNNPEFKEKLAIAGLNKPSNSDCYTTYMAEFVETFGKIAMPDHFKYLFFVEGGSVAVENGLKVAMDWKVRKNFAKGIKEEKGGKVMHFKQAFHGRTGYTLSLTNTDPNKTKYFPKFDWPRISNPKIIFPLSENLERVIAAENQAIDEIYSYIKTDGDDICCIIIEPIQAEGGDNHFRKEFFVKLREICDQNDILLMFDEVQTGLGITGKWWAAEHFVMPDITAFGKKVQVCGIMVSDRIDDVENHCFKKSSRINSTWGGNLVDMVRAQKIIEVIHEENILDNVNESGNYLLSRIKQLEKNFPGLVSESRGLGLLCSFNMPDGVTRNKFIDHANNQNLAILGCGERSVRFRTPLIITKGEIDEGFEIIENVLNLLNKH